MNVLCVVLCLLFLCSCGSGDTTSDATKAFKQEAGDMRTEIFAWIDSRLGELGSADSDKVTEKHFEVLLTAMERGDSTEIYNLFAPNIQNASEGFLDSIRTLFSLLDGEVIVHKSLGAAENESVELGIKIVDCSNTFEVQTSTSKYVFTIYEVLRDDKDSNNVGLHRVTVCGEGRECLTIGEDK